MPYLLSKNSTTNLLIDKTGESIYYRMYPVKYNQRAVVIAKSLNHDYAAILDDTSHLHLIYKSSTNSLVHLFEKNNKFESMTLLEDHNNTYQITNLKYLYHQKNYLFYCAYNPFEKTSDLILHTFLDHEQTEPQSLFSIPSLSTHYECLIVDNTLYLLCQTLSQEGEYEINLYPYNVNTSTWDDYETIAKSINPFMDYAMCIQDHIVHITYVERDKGKNIIYYTQKSSDVRKPIAITDSNSILSPIIFIYNHIIWVNWKENNQLMHSLSSNNGETFNQSRPCSAQSPEATYYYFYGYTNQNLMGHKFYGYINGHPILAVLSQVDTDNILLNNYHNLEMKSLINNFSSKDNGKLKILEQEIETHKEVQQNISNQYDNLAKMAKELQTQAKMWKNKYAVSEKEIKKLKKKLRRKSIEHQERITRVTRHETPVVKEKTLSQPLSASQDFIHSPQEDVAIVAPELPGTSLKESLKSPVSSKLSEPQELKPTVSPTSSVSQDSLNATLPTSSTPQQPLKSSLSAPLASQESIKSHLPTSSASQEPLTSKEPRKSSDIHKSFKLPKSSEKPIVEFEDLFE
ncbi:hypothetical protein HZI73_15755 [Vallitalea pronyensis]|uniref:Uncharacterized protein n=1 Tax=Vallitalea pronyensis TaxID=1348613 RepID=A0A8J8ML24_9FIRM|nr:hypothetical protein [Vallitalea pronyensis]QUI23655.1 hypothetical protein HZI73_15755 [Vallitalea pronyensis]